MMESEDEFVSTDEINGIDHIGASQTGDAMGILFNQDIRPLIDLVDKLRRYGIQQDVELPNVVVVGDQSSGKSSIIEALSGVQLPRGKGIVTRCPLELQLKRVYNKAWVARLSYRDMKGKLEELEINNPEEVEYHVRNAQEAICGKGKCVSGELITLRLESPEETAPDLTLIDLPGISRIAVDDQPENICDTIRTMIMKYVQSERTVILCVLSANLDVAVNESIKIARTVDPLGERTIGVITKPDSAEESHKEDVLCVLNNEKIKLQKGFTMVKCRSQPELDNKVSLKESLQNEREFFDTDRVYKQANRSQLGTMNLARKISEELVNVIRKSLPELKEQIESALQKAYKDLECMAEPIPGGEVERRSYLSKLIWDLTAVLKKSLNEGKNCDKTENYYYEWRQYFTEFLKAMNEKTTRILENDFSAPHLKDRIMRARGRELNGFLDFDIMKTIIPQYINTYETDAIELLKKMRKNVEDCLVKAIRSKCKHLPDVERDIKEIINIETKKFQDEATLKIKFIFKQESIIFTMDAIFNKELNAFKRKKNEAAQEAARNNRNMYGQLSISPDDLDTNSIEMHDMLKVYLEIVNHRLSDTIPLTIMQCLLMDLSRSLEGRFIETCSSNDLIDKVKENPKLADQRNAIKGKINRLQKAISKLTRF